VIEYALIGALASLVSVAILTSMAGSLKNLLSLINTQVPTAQATATGRYFF